MVHVLSQSPDVAGRLGKGIAQGLSDQIPREIEQYRLSQGLKQLEKESPNLTPTQFYTRALSIPGLTPQGAQGFAELARQQTKAQGLSKQQQRRPSPFKQKEPSPASNEEKAPSLTQEEPLAQLQEGYIPPTQDEIIEDAGRRFDENPELFGNDPQKAIEAAENAAIREERRQLAFEKKHENLSKIQDNVVSRLKGQSDKLNVQIPATTYSKIEDKAIQATKSKKQGGRGLTEQEAIKEFGDELDAVSKDYSKLSQIGNWGIVGRKSNETLRTIKSLQEKFEKRDDTENFADRLISENKLSPKVAYAIAEPVSRSPSINKAIKELPPLPAAKPLLEYQHPELMRKKTLEIMPQLAQHFAEDNGKISPLAVAYELEKKGYDPQVWLDYLTDNRKSLNLKENQGRQLDTPNNLIPTMNDWWLSSWSGMEK